MADWVRSKRLRTHHSALCDGGDCAAHLRETFADNGRAVEVYLSKPEGRDAVGLSCPHKRRLWVVVRSEQSDLE